MFKLFVAASIIFCLIGVSAPAAEEEQPSLELLEFLGDWSIDDDGWLDPAELDEMDLSEQEHDDEKAKK